MAALLHSLPEYPGLHVAVVHTALDEQEVHVPFGTLGHTASQTSAESPLSSNVFAAQAVPPHVLEF